MPEDKGRFFSLDSYEDPIDLIESLAEHKAWECDRVDDELITMEIDGQWTTYSVTLAWSTADMSLRLVCSYAIDPPEEKLPALYEAINHVNDQYWHGSFTYWDVQKLMVWRYTLILEGCDGVHADQVEQMIQAALVSCECSYPCFVLAVWGDTSPQAAVQAGIAEAYGTA